MVIRLVVWLAAQLTVCPVSFVLCVVRCAIGWLCDIVWTSNILMCFIMTCLEYSGKTIMAPMAIPMRLFVLEFGAFIVYTKEIVKVMWVENKLLATETCVRCLGGGRRSRRSRRELARNLVRRLTTRRWRGQGKGRLVRKYGRNDLPKTLLWLFATAIHIMVLGQDKHMMEQEQ